MTALEIGRECLRQAGFKPRRWTQHSEDFFSTSVWAEGKIGTWKPTIWLVPQQLGRSLLVPGFRQASFHLWSRPLILRGLPTESMRQRLARPLINMRQNLWCWSKLPVPLGAGEKIGPAVDRILAPWAPDELPHHGSVWQGREPMEYRGLTLLEALEEILEEEWKWRLRYGYTLQQAAKVMTRFYYFWTGEWGVPALVKEEAKSDTESVWLYERKPRKKAGPSRARRSLISDDTARRLREEWKEIKNA